MINTRCPIERTLDVLNGKWTILILRDLFTGPKRFGELRRSLRPISQKILTDRLRALEDQGVVTRTEHSKVPLHVEYQLTERGQSIRPIFDAMKAWIQSEDAGSSL